MNVWAIGRGDKRTGGTGTYGIRVFATRSKMIFYIMFDNYRNV